MMTMTDRATPNMKPNAALGPYCVYSVETKTGLRVRARQPPAVNIPIHVPCIRSTQNLIITENLPP